MKKLMEYAKKNYPDGEYEYLEERKIVIITMDNGKYVFEVGYYSDGEIYDVCHSEPMD